MVVKVACEKKSHVCQFREVRIIRIIHGGTKNPYLNTHLFTLNDNNMEYV
jgi:hypothetical protein